MSKAFVIIWLICLIGFVALLVGSIISDFCWAVYATETHTVTITKLDYSTEGRYGNFNKFIATIHYDGGDMVIELDEYQYSYYQVGDTATLTIDKYVNSLTKKVKYIYTIKEIDTDG